MRAPKLCPPKRFAMPHRRPHRGPRRAAAVLDRRRREPHCGRAPPGHPAGLESLVRAALELEDVLPLPDRPHAGRLMATRHDQPGKAKRTGRRSTSGCTSSRTSLQRYRRTWRGTVVVSIVNPLLFLLAIGRRPRQGRHDHPAGAGRRDLPRVLRSRNACGRGHAERHRRGRLPVSRASRSGGTYSVAITTPLDSTDIMLGHCLYMAFKLALGAVTFVAVMTVSARRRRVGHAHDAGCHA